jgi:hypothetical protein
MIDFIEFLRNLKDISNQINNYAYSVGVIEVHQERYTIGEELKTRIVKEIDEINESYLYFKELEYQYSFIAYISEKNEFQLTEFLRIAEFLLSGTTYNLKPIIELMRNNHYINGISFYHNPYTYGNPKTIGWKDMMYDIVNKCNFLNKEVKRLKNKSSTTIQILKPKVFHLPKPEKLDCSNKFYSFLKHENIIDCKKADFNRLYSGVEISKFTIKINWLGSQGSLVQFIKMESQPNEIKKNCNLIIQSCFLQRGNEIKANLNSNVKPSKKDIALIDQLRNYLIE